MSDRCACYDTLVVKDLNRWFKEKWVDVSRKDKDGKHPPCGRSKASKSSKGYPKCRPSVKVSGKTPKTSGSMSEGEKRAATKRKRSKKQGVGGKPTIVKATYQSNLGEHHDDFPSPYGPVVGYHGTTGDNFMDIMAGSGLRNPDPNYRHITTSPSEAATYALQRSGGNRGVVDWQSQPKLIGVRQAAFDQNHPNYIGPSHGLKNSDDYQGAQHYGGNIPRQFLTSTPMSNEILGDTMQARDGSQYIIDRNMSYPAESTDHARRRFQEEQDTDSNQPPLMNLRGEVKPEKPRINRLAMEWRPGYAEKYQQRMDNHNQQMAQYMQPNPVQQPIDPQQQQLDVQFEQPQMIQQGEPMDMAWRLLKNPVSPEAKRHKLEYDKQYESNPKRVKYREELNRERRKRGIYGQGGPDMSHTRAHTLVAESPHANRARHFKERGTLK